MIASISQLCRGLTEVTSKEGGHAFDECHIWYSTSSNGTLIFTAMMITMGKKSHRPLSLAVRLLR